MAFSAHKSEEEIKEHYSEETKVTEQAKLLAKWIRESSHMTAFTGAGISTSAGISDFRGPQGVWTLRAQGKQPRVGVNTICALPTSTHMSLVALEAAGLLKFLITQNCDGLHRRSGFPAGNLAELHGNSMLEYCSKCAREYVRDYRVRRAKNNVHNHKTDRKCPACSGHLLDSIINFSESLPEKHIEAGFKHSRASDLCLVLGSSLTVTPAADMPRKTAKNGRLVICNLQKTPLDDKAEMRVFAKTDHFMALVMKELDLSIPQWKLIRRLNLSTADSANIQLSGVTDDNLPDSFIKQASLLSNNTTLKTLLEEPFLFSKSLANDPSVSLILQFMGHYMEPPLALNIADILNQSTASEVRLTLTYNPIDRSWTVA